MEKAQADRLVVRQFDGMKIQDVAFDGKGVGTESGAVADICDRLKNFAVDLEIGYIYADRGSELIVAGQVDGWNRVLGAVAAPAPLVSDTPTTFRLL